MREYLFDIESIITEQELDTKDKSDIMQQVVVKLLQQGMPLKRYDFHVEYENGKDDHFQTDEDGKTDMSDHKIGAKLKLWVNDNASCYDLLVKEGVKEYVFNVELAKPKMQDVEVVILQNSVPVINLPFTIIYDNNSTHGYITDNNGRAQLLSQNVGTLIHINVPDYNENFEFEVKDGIKEYTFELKPKVVTKEQNVIAIFLQDGKAIDQLNIIVHKADGSSTKYTTNKKGQILLSYQKANTSLTLEVEKLNKSYELIVQEGVEEYIFNLKQPFLLTKKKSIWWLALLEILVLIVSAILFYLAWPYVWDFANTIVNTIV